MKLTAASGDGPELDLMEIGRPGRPERYRVGLALAEAKQLWRGLSGKSARRRPGHTRSGPPRVEALEREIEQIVICLIPLRQPMAGDLRMIIGALEASDEIECIGDHAANVAKRSIVLTQVPPSFGLVGLAHMADLVQQNVQRMVTALQENTGAIALEVWRADKDVDDMYNVVFRELMTSMLESSRNITPCTHLLFVTRSLERDR